VHGRRHGRLRLAERRAVRAELETGMLATLPSGEPFAILTQISWHENRWKSLALEAFMEDAREIFP
jgi:hypothetical protein